MCAAARERNRSRRGGMPLSFWEIAQGDAVGERKNGCGPIRLKSAARRSLRAKRMNVVIALSTSSYKSPKNAIRFETVVGRKGGGGREERERRKGERTSPRSRSW